ncbi:hypothetical protein DYB32_010269 [Aphanomyces invadans]|uniref:HSF-type DNA-binding domain-containing protein n=1 Tax=Aphanomyces invadans TaxID=157072 RepID=A0A3R6WF59_9STRA|nr:hypothetical protein DYB32_010269 [Aphanomyces invadans]
MTATSPRHSLDTVESPDVDLHELLLACEVNVLDVQEQDVQLPNGDLNSDDFNVTVPGVDFSALLSVGAEEYDNGDDWIAMNCDGSVIDTYSSDDSMEILAANDLGPTPDVAPSEASEKGMVYLAKIHSMLEQCPSSVAAWTNGGSSFAIYNWTALEKTILPTYFKPIKFESFARQLNSYGFKKTKLVENHTIVFEFTHPLFVRGQVDQLKTIKRRRRRMQRWSAVDVEDMTDAELRSTFSDVVRMVQTMHAEVAEMKSLVQSLVETSPCDAPTP